MGTPKIIHVPDVPKPTATLCYEQAPTLVRCDRKLGHLGLHSWQSEMVLTFVDFKVKEMLKSLALVLAVLLLPALAHAQTVTTYSVQAFAPGVPITGAPTAAQDYPIAAVTCNQTPPTDQADPVNPITAAVDDPQNAGKVCTWNIASFIAGLTPQAGDWNLTTTASNSAGSSARSAAHPFQRLGPPSVPTGLRLRSQ